MTPNLRSRCGPRSETERAIGVLLGACFVIAALGQSVTGDGLWLRELANIARPGLVVLDPLHQEGYPLSLGIQATIGFMVSGEWRHRLLGKQVRGYAVVNGISLQEVGVRHPLQGHFHWGLWVNRFLGLFRWLVLKVIEAFESAARLTAGIWNFFARVERVVLIPSIPF